MSLPPLTRRAFGAVSALSAAAVWAPAIGVRAQTDGAALGRVTVAVGGQGVLYHLPLALADALGYFRLEGLDVVVRDYSAGALAWQAVQDGAADVCSGAFEHVLRAQARGHAYRALVVQGRAPQLALGVSLRSVPAYKDLGDLAGRKVGVSSVGSSTHLAASLMLMRAGVPLRDVAFVGVGSGTNAMNALRSGQVQALCHADPIMTLLEQKADTRIVGDLRSLKAAQDMFSGTMPASCLYAPQAFIQKQPAQAQALVNGVVHALKWLQTAGLSDINKVVPESYFQGDRALYLAAFSRAREAWSPDGLMPDAGPATMARVMSRFDTASPLRQVDLSQTFTNDMALKAKARFKA